MFLKELINFMENCDFGEVLCFRLFWIFWVTDGHLFNFKIFGDYIALRRWGSFGVVFCFQLLWLFLCLGLMIY